MSMSHEAPSQLKAHQKEHFLKSKWDKAVFKKAWKHHETSGQCDICGREQETWTDVIFNDRISVLTGLCLAHPMEEVHRFEDAVWKKVKELLGMLENSPRALEKLAANATD